MKSKNNVEPNNVPYSNYYSHKTYTLYFHINKYNIMFIVWGFLLNFCHISLPSWQSKPNFSSFPPKPALSAAFPFCLS